MDLGIQNENYFNTITGGRSKIYPASAPSARNVTNNALYGIQGIAQNVKYSSSRFRTWDSRTAARLNKNA